MEKKIFRMTGFMVAILLAIFVNCDQVMAEETGDVTYGNNLSVPVVFSGTPKALRGTAGMSPELNGQFWYHWGVDENGNPLSCAPDPDDNQFCDDGKPETVGSEPGGRQRAYLQQDPYNVWQADTVIPEGIVFVDEIDFGDNLEAVPWYLNSMVRIEVVLMKSLMEEVKEYEMLHVSGWGQDEMWGFSVSEGGNRGEIFTSQATVYSHCARLTIQKLSTDKADPLLEQLVWVEPNEATGVIGGWTGDDLVNPPLFTGAVRNAGDGPGYYNAEINVKGKIVYGYTWNVRNMNEGPGYYRFTFSLDESCPELNTFFSPETTCIYIPEEEEEITTSSETVETPSGGTAVISGENIAYIDVLIKEERTSRKGGNKKK